MNLLHDGINPAAFFLLFFYGFFLKPVSEHYNLQSNSVLCNVFHYYVATISITTEIPLVMFVLCLFYILEPKIECRIKVLKFKR